MPQLTRLKSTLLLILLFFNCHFIFAQEKSPNRIFLPLTFEKGYGDNFGVMLFALGAIDDDLAEALPKINQKVQGLPAKWKKIKQRVFVFDRPQFVYQNYLAGYFSKELSQNLSYDFDKNTSALSQKPIKCYVNWITGEDENGVEKSLIDTNNNLDFSDERGFDLKDYDPLSPSNILEINYETNFEKEIIEQKVYFQISKSQGHLFYQFPQYATTKLAGLNSPAIEIYTNPISHSLSVFVVTDSLKVEDKMMNKQTAQINDYIKINREVYKIIGLTASNKLELERISEPPLYASSTGFQAIPIKGFEFSSKQPISSADYKGKYLFVEFWGTWCGGCIADIPALKQIYNKVDKRKVEFLGIAGHDQPKDLEKFFSKTPIPWPQILSSAENPIPDHYNITGYPASVLIDPDGKIIAKNLHSSQLEVMLEKLLN